MRGRSGGRGRAPAKTGVPPGGPIQAIPPVRLAAGILRPVAAVQARASGPARHDRGTGNEGRLERGSVEGAGPPARESWLKGDCAAPTVMVGRPEFVPARVADLGLVDRDFGPPPRDRAINFLAGQAGSLGHVDLDPPLPPARLLHECRDYFPRRARRDATLSLRRRLLARRPARPMITTPGPRLPV